MVIILKIYSQFELTEHRKERIFKERSPGDRPRSFLVRYKLLFTEYLFQGHEDS
jgi:hypothetical protein